MNKLKLEALLTSLVLYLLIVATLILVTIYTPSKHKAKNYTDKKSNVIEVSLGSPNQHKSTLNKKVHKKESSKKSKKVSKKEKQTKKSKRVRKVRNHKHKDSKKAKKIARKKSKKSTKHTKTKVTHSKPNTKNLFSKISKEVTQQSHSSSGNSGKSFNKVNKQSGIVNRYFAKVQNKLRGWPAQSNFAGEKVSVELTIYSSGLFTYKILHRSINPQFNESLKNYLEQLKRIGFGAHSNPKPYKIIVDFIAKG